MSQPDPLPSADPQDPARPMAITVSIRHPDLAKPEPHPSPSTVPPEGHAIPGPRDAPAVDDSPSGRPSPIRGLPAWRETLGQLVRDFQVDHAPLVEQDWLWEATPPVPFHTLERPAQATEDLEYLLNSERATHSRMMTRAPLTPDDSFGTLLLDLNRVLNLWDGQPLVWRERKGEIQVVCRGACRFTWSLAHPAGRAEQSSRQSSSFMTGKNNDGLAFD